MDSYAPVILGILIFVFIIIIIFILIRNRSTNTSCSVDSDCSNGEICSSNICVVEKSKSKGRSCSDTRECANELVCLKGRCSLPLTASLKSLAESDPNVGANLCSKTSDCGSSGIICLNGYCTGVTDYTFTLPTDQTIASQSAQPNFVFSTGFNIGTNLSDGTPLVLTFVQTQAIGSILYWSTLNPSNNSEFVTAFMYNSQAFYPATSNYPDRPESYVYNEGLLYNAKQLYVGPEAWRAESNNLQGQDVFINLDYAAPISISSSGQLVGGSGVTTRTPRGGTSTTFGTVTVGSLGTGLVILDQYNNPLQISTTPLSSSVTGGTQTAYWAGFVDSVNYQGQTVPSPTIVPFITIIPTFSSTLPYAGP